MALDCTRVFIIIIKSRVCSCATCLHFMCAMYTVFLKHRNKLPRALDGATNFKGVFPTCIACVLYVVTAWESTEHLWNWNDWDAMKHFLFFLNKPSQWILEKKISTAVKYDGALPFISFFFFLFKESLLHKMVYHDCHLAEIIANTLAKKRLFYFDQEQEQALL